MSALLNIAFAIAFIYAVIKDIINDKLGWVVFEIFVFPVGVIRGILMFFGVI